VGCSLTPPHMGAHAAEAIREGMTSDFVLWFDARCATCRRALQLLRERGVEPTLRRFLEEPPTAEELRALVARLGLPPHALARKDADEYHALRLSDRSPDEDVLAALLRHPRIIAGPVLVHGARAVIARPPERVLDLVSVAA
jgi:arsenate reductase